MSTSLINWRNSPSIVNDVEYVSTTNSTYKAAKSNTSVPSSSGKKYLCEVYVKSIEATYTSIGVTDNSGTFNETFVFGHGATEFAYRPNGQKINSYSSATYGSSYTAGDVISIIIDTANSQVSFAKNGIWQGVAYSISTLTNIVIAVGSFYIGSDLVFNFGSSTYKYIFKDCVPFDTTFPTLRSNVYYDYVQGTLTQLEGDQPISIDSDHSILTTELESIVSKQSHRQGVIISNINLSNRIQNIKSGFIQNNIYTGLRSNNKNGFIMGGVINGNRVSNKRGVLLSPLLFSTNAIDHVKLVVTPTTTFFGSGISIYAENKLRNTGKYRLYINNSIVLPYGTDDVNINKISFDMNLSALSIGDNSCRLEYKYNSTSSEYVDFIIRKDSDNREEAITRLHWYSGGFDISGTNIELITTDQYKSNILLTGSKQTATLKTTDYTSIDLKHSKGIQSIDLDCDARACLFLVSFDNRNTWYSFINNQWVSCSPGNISSQGMNRDTLASITRDQWDLVFVKTKLDLIVYMDDSLAVSPITGFEDNVVWDTIMTASGTVNVYTTTYTVPDNITISNLSIIDVASSDNAGTLYLKAYDAQNNVITCGSASGPGINFSTDIPDTFAVVKLVAAMNTNHMYYGQNKRHFYAYGSIKRAWLKSLSVVFVPNSYPYVTNVSLSPETTHSSSILTAHIKDIDGDQAQYSVLINGETLLDYTPLNSSEGDITIDIPSSTTSVGTNLITIMTYDGITYSEPQNIYLTKIDEAPTITGILSYGILKAVISDMDEGDTVRYKILVNGVIKNNWSDYQSTPISIEYKCDRNDILIGKQNTITVVSEDNLGVSTSIDFDFVGEYYGILFTDENQNLFSNDIGEVIQKLDFGTIFAGNSSTVKEVQLVNKLDNLLQNILVTSGLDTSDDINLQFSNSDNPFIPEDNFTVSTININDKKSFFVRISIKKTASGGTRDFAIKLEAED